jgi:hypothetical protein
MHSQSRLFAYSAIALVALLLAMFGGTTNAMAADLSYAGVVVRHDDGRMSYAYVGFKETSITGVELLKRTGLEIVTAAFGGLGEGVCSIDEHGCPVTECRMRVCQGPGENDPFWQYFRQSALGEWKPVALGASSTMVRNGDIDGWSWTPTKPELPALTLDDVARLAGYEGSSFSGMAFGEPGAVLRREGSAVTDDRQAPATYAAGGAILLAATVAIAVLAWRRRIVRAA